MFLDTQVFRKERFDWDGSNFRALSRRIQAGSVRVLSTEILRGELRKQAAILQNEFVQAFAKAESLSAVPRLLNMVPSNGLRSLTPGKLEQHEVEQAADKLLSLLQVEELPIPEGALPRLFEIYFGGEPPFGVKGKKSEFPDAVNMLALQSFAQKLAAKVYIISDDGDWARISEKHEEFILFERMEPFLDMAVRAEFASSQFWSNEEILKSFAPYTDELKDLVFIDLSLMSRVNLGDGSLDELKFLEFSLRDILVTDIRSEKSGLRCVGELEVELRFTAEMSLDDPGLANVLYGHTEGDVTLLGSIEFVIDPKNPNAISDINLMLEEGLELELPLAY